MEDTQQNHSLPSFSGYLAGEYDFMLKLLTIELNKNGIKLFPDCLADLIFKFSGIWNFHWHQTLDRLWYINWFRVSLLNNVMYLVNDNNNDNVCIPISAAVKPAVRTSGERLIFCVKLPESYYYGNTLKNTKLLIGIEISYLNGRHDEMIEIIKFNNIFNKSFIVDKNIMVNDLNKFPYSIKMWINIQQE